MRTSIGLRSKGYIYEMIKSLLTISFSFFVYFSCFSQYHTHMFANYKTKNLNYVHSPNSKDIKCKNDVLRANKAIENGQKIFCVPTGLYYSNMRFKKELVSILDEMNYTIYWDTIKESNLEGQTEGCFCSKIISNNLKENGLDFRKNIIEKADQMYAERVFANDEIINIWHLDTYPQTKVDKVKDKYYTYELPEVDSACSDYSFISFIFVLDQNDKLIKVNESLEIRNKNIPNSCIESAHHFIQQQIKADQWQTGKIHGRKVKSRKHVRLYLIRSSEPYDEE